MNLNIPDLTKIHWQLNVAFIAAAFSVFSLIYNDKYIYYGFLTFVYGIVSASILPAIEQWLPQNKWRNYLIIQSVLTMIWIISCWFIGTAPN